MKPYMRPVWAGACIAGPAVTILAQPGDNWMLHVAIEQCQPGDIVVLGCTTDNTDGMIGDLIATSLKARGVKGVIIDAGCRDVATLKEMGFPIWARAISSKGTVKATSVRSIFRWSAPASMSSRATRWWPTTTAWSWCRRNIASRPRPKAQKRFDDEEAKRTKLASGVLGLDMYNMREPLAKAGLVYVDNPEDVE